MKTRKAIIIGAGISGPAIALQFKRIGIQSVVYESRPRLDVNEGVFLGLTPNGQNAIRELVNLSDLREEYTPGKMSFYNARNRKIGELDTARQREQFGAETIQIKRGKLNGLLWETTLAQDIPIQTGKRITGLQQTANGVEVTFADGTGDTADLLIGCDGVHAATRKLLFPHSPQPHYTGLLSTGAYAYLPGVEHLFGSIHMVFGEKAFFAYAVSNKGEVWWFNNYRRPLEPSPGEVEGELTEEIKRRLLDLHRNDPDPILPIIAATDAIAAYPIYDLPFLERWYQGSVCLLGDAAHATSPHIGQGASLALEDTVVLAKCLRDISQPERAFAAFQARRQERVRRIVQQARKVGDQKTSPGKIGQLFRDLLLPFFVRQEARKTDWVYAYRENWQEPITT
jgi:2-polyprenyl-6-methoxyphenol hydroxylase-like FAD-dependent oxidoreductase